MIRARGHAAIGTKVINPHSTSDRDARDDRGARPLAGLRLGCRAQFNALPAFTTPLRTGSPTARCTGSGSPVNADSSSTAIVSRTRPSTGRTSPGPTTSTSSTATSFSGVTRISEPTRRRANRGARSSSARKSWEARRSAATLSAPPDQRQHRDQIHPEPPFAQPRPAAPTPCRAPGATAPAIQHSPPPCAIPPATLEPLDPVSTAGTDLPSTQRKSGTNLTPTAAAAA